MAYMFIRRLLISCLTLAASSAWTMGSPMADLDLENFQVFENVRLTDSDGSVVTLSRENMGHGDMRSVGFTGESVELKAGTSEIPFRVPNRLRSALFMNAGPEAFDRILIKTPCSGQSVGLEIHKLNPTTYQLSLITNRGTIAASAEFHKPISLYHGHQL